MTPTKLADDKPLAEKTGLSEADIQWIGSVRPTKRY
ncbi:hypothetical protein Thivi_1746 [Thiocystis violascens DSM 198]|uniref:Uncharacterized protein n=1 Tax=Thiocystis violascens (strain ATCC 17096 / DSM 198 / 6111) TaxID=765911 RepID=I3Y9Q2_THIV6|nr:hypothetical protein Thivi_1746 [Thiocystis violascens DSM 198]